MSLLEDYCCSARDLRAWDSVSWLSIAIARLLHQLLPPRSLIILDFEKQALLEVMQLAMPNTADIRAQECYYKHLNACDRTCLGEKPRC